MRFLHTWIITVTLLAACSAPPVATATPTSTSTHEPATFTASAVPSRTPTPAPSLTPTPTWVAQGPDHVQVPIFMYHHIAESPIGSRYYVPPVNFEAQLKLLRDWEYTTISTSMLVESITQGAALPPHPIIITFDDANEDNYAHAFPIMQKYGFTGVLYLPYFYIGTPNYLTVDQIQEMAAAGWEIGSHTLNHPTNFLALQPAALRAEIVELSHQAERAAWAADPHVCISFWGK